ncbi:MAG TPA: hypothetical protein VI750_11870, partial [Pyrinomonadaceae bacterium]|nr:hypothetical protein [Pyrinomonadaceae bacterium]
LVAGNNSTAIVRIQEIVENFFYLFTNCERKMIVLDLALVFALPHAKDDGDEKYFHEPIAGMDGHFSLIRVGSNG